MANKLDNLNPYNKGTSGNPNGRPKGVRNRSTILRELLSLDENEYKMHVAQITKAIELRDTNAYKAVLDSAYGAPIQQIEQTNIEQPLFKLSDHNDGN